MSHPIERHLLRAKDLADGHYTEPIGVAAMAEAAGLSRAHFSRAFKDVFGQSPHVYLLTRRLERAASLLRHTDHSVADICMSVGLTSVGSFTTSFKRMYGGTPTAYRAAAPPASAYAVVPACVMRAYGRPSHVPARKSLPAVLTAWEIITFDETPAPPGESPWVPGAGPAVEVDVVDPDPTWPQRYDELAARIRRALRERVLDLQHVGSTAVPHLPAKPIVDIDLTVADPDDELAYVAALEAEGFELRVREPWWHGHRLLRFEAPLCHLHVFGPDSPELVRHRIFRDWLRSNPTERDLYAAGKREAAAAAKANGEHSMQYNARKERLVREIYQRAFVAAGLIAE